MSDDFLTVLTVSLIKEIRRRTKKKNFSIVSRHYYLILYNLEEKKGHFTISRLGVLG
jgi:hypothetical protein